MRNNTKRILDFIALHPGRTIHNIPNDPDYSGLYTHANQQNSAVIETLVEIGLVTSVPGPQKGVDWYGADTYYISDTLPFVYGIAFGKTGAIPMECPECGKENHINPMGNLAKTRKCRHCNTVILPERLPPVVVKEPGEKGFLIERSPELQANDIVVSCPVDNQDFLNEKVRNPEDSFWDFARKPVKLTEANRVFVLYDGVIRYNFEVAKIEQGPLPPVEDAEGHNPGVPEGGCRIWFNECYVIESKDLISFKGFQGFRYRWW